MTFNTDPDAWRRIAAEQEVSVEQSLAGAIHVERLAMAIHNVKGGSPMFGEPGECECREDAAAIADEYERLGAERNYLRRLPWRENVVVDQRQVYVRTEAKG